MLKNILLRILATSYIICTTVMSSEAPDLFATSIPLDRSHSLYNTRYNVEPELSIALQKTYSKKPSEIVHGDYVDHAKRYYSSEFPNLLKDDSYKFEIFQTPIVCISSVRDLRHEGILTAIAIPSLTGGAWQHYEEIGISSRFENIDNSKILSKGTFCLPVKVSASKSFFDALTRDEELKIVFNKIALIHFETALSVQTLIAFDETDSERTLRVELTAEALRTGKLKPVLIYSPLEEGAFRHGVPYAN